MIALQYPPFVHALIAGTLIAIACGVIGPFVVTRSAAFMVHGTAELALTGAAAGLLIAGNPVAGALIGSFVVATAFGVLGGRLRQRDTAVGVVLAFGLGLGVFLLSFYSGFATAAINILFGDIYGVSAGQITLLLIVLAVVLLVTATIWRPLQFASVDPDLAEARGVRTGLLGLVFLYVLAVTVTEAAQIVGTTLVLALAITPAAAASRLSARPLLVTALAAGFAVVATDGGLLLSIEAFPARPVTAFVTFISFGFYVVARLVAALRHR